MTDFNFVDDPSSLLDEFAGAGRIGVDTEFLREKTFMSQLCLVQISTPQKIYCVDPLTPASYDDFWKAICEPEWILHSGRQDIEVVYQTAGEMPSRLFDTQVAAGLLGYAPQMGYANLVGELFDVQLPKTHTRADWSQRPLPPALLEYAADDVEYLLRAWETLSERLDKAGRLAWAHEDSEFLLDAGLYELNPADAVARLKGARNLRGRQRTIAARLAAWRETEAYERNRPRQWILRDSTVLEIATRQPDSKSALASIKGVPPKLADRAGDALLEIIEQSDGALSAYEPPSPPNEQQKAVLKVLQKMVAERAGELGISAEILAPRKELSAAVISGNFESRVFRGWRNEIIGEELRSTATG